MDGIEAKEEAEDDHDHDHDYDEKLKDDEKLSSTANGAGGSSSLF